MKELRAIALILSLLTMCGLFSEERHLIVLPTEFSEAVEELVDYFADEYEIERELHEIDVIIEGTDDPAEALHEYLQEYFSEAGIDWGASSVLLLGAGTSDWESGSERNRIPVYEVNNIITDTGFVDFDENPGSEVAIGRIPVSNEAELSEYLENYLEYLDNVNGGLWQRRLLFTADDEINNGMIEGAYPGSGMNHSNVSDDLMDSITEDYLFQEVYGIDYIADEEGNKPEAASEITEMINQGVGLWSYVGHGSYNCMGDEEYFKTEDISNLTNDGKRGFMFAASCNIGRFYEQTACLGEQLLICGEGGIIGCIVPAGNTGPTYNLMLGEYLLPLLYDAEQYWGEALRESQNESGASIFNSIRYILLGDPLGKINNGRYGELTLDPGVDLIVPGEEELLGWNCGAGYNEVLFAVQEASSCIEYINTIDDVIYEYNRYRPGELVFVGIAGVIGGRAEILAAIPQDCVEGEDGRVICSTQNEGETEILFSMLIEIGESGINGEDIVTMVSELSNYPNPFNPRTMIRYYLEEESRVELVVYNIKGELVKKIIDTEQMKGWQLQEWDGRTSKGKAAGSGVYLLQLRNNEVMISRKISLLK